MLGNPGGLTDELHNFWVRILLHFNGNTYLPRIRKEFIIFTNNLTNELYII